ncbi:MAG: hypothetical protein A2015_16955 [Spirochaetes bacterium GWF1_31_7]|nr:MAG: hypothetical protein A2Y30_14320 [Spirochaetes bacterium GWE1_32_154]OHD50132.1 MAG: hypothetical protein A2Y29_12365 [Spirochaetes bacterium GWE2_31_10]OHD52446.1 MAG: hypothetical protein A2015_16955 [Spirochaetes bacterium GWF1_31_7]OHD80088.1 MAG: hypothetical protein A2355_12035 [Spirochaetes bacterium RIFOXYB1_FULL_32_8]HBD96091.1 hypothetical protein [Spirochaetia bacterium]
MGRKLKGKIFLSLSFFLVLFTFVNAQPDTQRVVNNKLQLFNSTRAGEELIVHYQRTEKDYTDFTLWLWEDTSFVNGGWPFGLDYATTDDFGAVFKVPLIDNAQKIGFVPVNKKLGDSSKDAGDHVFNFVNDYKEIWVFQGDTNCYISKEKALAKGIIGGQIVSETKLSLTFVNVNALLVTELTITDNTGTTISATSLTTIEDNQTEITIATTDYKTKSPYNVKYGTKTITVVPGYKLVDAINYTGNDLGANYTSTATTFKLWAPTASSVKLVLYDKNNQIQKASSQFGLDVNGEIALVKANNAEPGVYSTTVTGDLKGYFYQYKVTNEGVEKTCLDPYAKSMAAFYVGSDGKVVTGAPDEDTVGKGAIVDLSATNVTGLNFAQETSANFNSYFTQRENAIIYEVHVRDFTSFWGVKTSGTTATVVTKPIAPLGTYKAFIQNLPYLKSMGYTHIQLLPIMNFYYGDESNKTIEANISGGDNNYNWGFDPHHYFTPEGMYATDEKDPHVRIKELKELVHAIHQNDMGVILDVVYTHMSKASFLDDIVPNYYFFMKDGNFVGGFGNNLATTHKMSQKIMVDSIKYMLNEYKIDGFRFDMMGDGTDESIMEVIKAAGNINPRVLLIGEGWRTFAGEGVTTDKGADQDAMNKMNDSSNGIYTGFTWTKNSGIGVFSDEFRNLMKSGFGGEDQPKFLTGGVIDIAQLFLNIKGQPGNFNSATFSLDSGVVNDPGQAVQYIAAHDNETLHDVIMMHTAKDPRDPGNEELIHKRIRMGNLVLLTSQGIAFMHAGQELGRTKSFENETGDGVKVRIIPFDNDKEMAVSKDSYDSSDYINMINWSFLEDGKPGKKTMEYTKGLIKLRKSTDAFRLGEKSLIDSNITVINVIK